LKKPSIRTLYNPERFPQQPYKRAKDKQFKISEKILLFSVQEPSKIPRGEQMPKAKKDF